jgi:hypothetical protein
VPISGAQAAHEKASNRAPLIANPWCVNRVIDGSGAAATTFAVRLAS